MGFSLANRTCSITKVTSETQQNTLQRSLQTQEKTPPKTGFGDTNELDAAQKPVKLFGIHLDSPAKAEPLKSPQSVVYNEMPQTTAETIAGGAECSRQTRLQKADQLEPARRYAFLSLFTWSLHP